MTKHAELMQAYADFAKAAAEAEKANARLKAASAAYVAEQKRIYQSNRGLQS